MPSFAGNGAAKRAQSAAPFLGFGRTCACPGHIELKAMSPSRWIQIYGLCCSSVLARHVGPVGWPRGFEIFPPACCASLLG